MKVSNFNRSHNSFRDNRLRTCKACISIQKKRKKKKKNRFRRTNLFQLLEAEPLLPDLLTSPKILGRNIRKVEEKVKDQWQIG